MVKNPIDYMNELGVLVTSHPRQQRFMHQAFASWEGFPYYMLLGYDDKNIDDLPLKDFMPPVKDTFVTNEPAGTLGHFRGELRQLKMGGKILAEKGFKYIYKTAADNACYRWRNLESLFKVVVGNGHNDMIICGTTQIFARLDVFNKCMELWHDKLKCGGAELYLYSQIRKFDAKVRYEKAPFWNKTLGLVHIQGEFAINHGITIIESWRRGLVWSKDYKHRDIVPGR